MTIFKSPQLEQLQQFLLENWQNGGLHNPAACIRKLDPTTRSFFPLPALKKCSVQEILTIYLLRQIHQMIVTAAQHVIPRYTQWKKSDYRLTNSLQSAQKIKKKKKDKQCFAWKHTRQNLTSIKVREKFSSKSKYFPPLLSIILQKYENKLARATRKQSGTEQTHYTAKAVTDHHKNPPVHKSRTENLPV